MITVALPNYASPIVWLAMESLCRQITPYSWELIVFEDSDKPMTKKLFDKYNSRLEKAGCIKTTYIYQKNRIALNQKWIKMSEMAHKDSKGIILQASDCYSEPIRLMTAEIFFSKGADWIDSPKGCFYDIRSKRTMMFDRNLGPETGLNMAISTGAMKSLPKNEEKWQGVDSWLFDRIKSPKIVQDNSSNWLSGLDTDGFSRLSIGRKLQYEIPTPPFFKTDRKINQILPLDISKRLEKICKF